MSWRFRKRIRLQEPGETWRWPEPEPPDNWKKDLFVISLLCLGMTAAEYAYCWLLAPGHDFRPKLGAWLVMLFMLLPNFWFAGVVYLTIQALWSWLQKTAAELKAGKTTILAVIGTAIAFLLAAWVFGSGGVRFIRSKRSRSNSSSSAFDSSSAALQYRRSPKQGPPFSSSSSFAQYDFALIRELISIITQLTFYLP
jgi:hypothetical protein